MNKSRIIRLSLALVIYAAAGWVMRGYITDDTYIHLRYAENLLQYGEFSFNPGQQTYGATSPLWIFGLALSRSTLNSSSVLTSSIIRLVCSSTVL